MALKYCCRKQEGFEVQYEIHQTSHVRAPAVRMALNSCWEGWWLNESCFLLIPTFPQGSSKDITPSPSFGVNFPQNVMAQQKLQL